MSAFVAAVAVIVLGSVGFWILRSGGPNVLRFFRSLDTMFETINGKPAEVDRSGREQKPSVPSLSVQLADLKDAVADQATQNRRITAVELMQAEHGRRLTAIESGHQLERITGNIAQGKVVDAIAEAGRRRETREGSIDADEA